MGRGLGVGEGVGLGVGLGVGPGVGLGLGGLEGLEGDSVGRGLGVGGGSGVGVGDGVGVGVGVGVGETFPVGSTGLGPPLLQPEIVMTTPLSIASAASSVNVRRSRFLGSCFVEGIAASSAGKRGKGRAGSPDRAGAATWGSTARAPLTGAVIRFRIAWSLLGDRLHEVDHGNSRRSAAAAPMKRAMRATTTSTAAAI